MSGYLVRHGETDANVSGITRGTANDISLTSKGSEQMQRVAHILRTKGVTSLRASDRRHIVQSMNIIGAIIHVPGIAKKELRSLDIGNYTEVKADEVDPIITKKIVSESSIPIGLTGEAPKDWIKTIWPEIKLFLEEIMDGRTPVLVTHGRPLNLIRAAIVGQGQFLDRATLEQYPTEKHGCLYEVCYDGNEFSIKGPING